MGSLDAEELFHLGLKASEAGDHEKAILRLKESLEKNPAAATQYILAAEYAEIGMYPRAIDGMERTITLDPTLWTAYLQKGMLHLVTGDPSSAQSSLAPLLDKEQLGSLHLFASGIDALLLGEPERAVALLKKGIELNESNPALNKDMERILAGLQLSLKQPDVDVGEKSKSESGESNRFFLSSYNKKL